MFFMKSDCLPPGFIAWAKAGLLDDSDVLIMLWFTLCALLCCGLSPGLLNFDTFCYEST